MLQLRKSILEVIIYHFLIRNYLRQARIQHLKEVSQTDEIAVFPFISNSGVFGFSHVSLSELRCQDPRYASDFLLLLIDQ